MNLNIKSSPFNAGNGLRQVVAIGANVEYIWRPKLPKLIQYFQGHFNHYIFSCSWKKGS